MPKNPLQPQMEAIYQNVPQDQIPWNLEKPPEALIELVTSGKIKPCKAVDLGCGTGNYALYLVSLGFKMTGIDLSSAAIAIATKKAKDKKIPCNFLACDLTGNIDQVKDKFDFAYDWDALHHVFPMRRKRYFENVAKLLKPGGIYYSVCFSIKDSYFGGTGKYRKTPIGTVLYFSSENELRRLLSPLFRIEEFKMIQVPGQLGPHHSWSVMMRKS